MLSVLVFLPLVFRLRGRQAFTPVVAT